MKRDIVIFVLKYVKHRRNKDVEKKIEQIHDSVIEWFGVNYIKVRVGVVVCTAIIIAYIMYSTSETFTSLFGAVFVFLGSTIILSGIFVIPAMILTKYFPKYVGSIHFYMVLIYISFL